MDLFSGDPMQRREVLFVRDSDSFHDSENVLPVVPVANEGLQLVYHTYCKIDKQLQVL